MGELLCEVMRPRVDMTLDREGEFLGPYPSGAPAIFIDTVARLGHTAGIIGGVGKDDFGKCILSRLTSNGVDCSHVNECDSGTTGVAFVTYFSDGSRRFLYHFPDTPATQAVAPEPKQLGTNIRLYHIMGCSLVAKKKFGEEIVWLMKQLVENGVKISFDPNIRTELMGDTLLVHEVMKHCNIFLPGMAELLAISGKSTPEEAVKHCFENPALEVIAVKNGSKGCTVFSRDSAVSLGTYPVEVKDPTGAGDCFDGAFVCGLLEGKTPLEAAKQASAAAALNAAAFGPMEGNISRESVDKLVNGNTNVVLQQHQY